LRSHSISTGLFTSVRVPCPPGTSTTSSVGAFAIVWSGITRMPFAQRTGSARSDMVTTRTSPSRSAAAIVNTSQGPDEVELLGTVEDQHSNRGHARTSARALATRAKLSR